MLSGTATIRHSTFTRNHANEGHAIFINSGTPANSVTLQNNLIYGNTGGTQACRSNQANAVSTSASTGNLMESSSNCGTPLSTARNLLLIDRTSASPLPYYAAAGSAAVDAVDCIAAVDRDLLGTSRPQGSRCDIGAIEAIPRFETGFSRFEGKTVPSAPTLSTNPGATGVTLTWSEVDPTDCGVITDYIAYIFLAADGTIVAEKSFSPSVRSGAVGGLTEDTAYTARMRVRSILGCYGAASAAQAFTTGTASESQSSIIGVVGPAEQAAPEPVEAPDGGDPVGSAGGIGPPGAGGGPTPAPTTGGGGDPVGGNPGSNPVGGGPVGGDSGGGNPGAGGSSGPGAGPAPAAHGAAALSTRIVGRRARSIDSPHCFVPGADELDTLPASTRLAYRLDSAQDFDLCLWVPDPNWRTAPAYASCRGAGGALPAHANILEGPGREELSVERAPELMACVVPAGTASEGGAWQLRIAPDNPEPENPE